MKYTIELVDTVPDALQHRMDSGFQEYESQYGIACRFQRFSLILKTESEEIVGVLNAFTAFAEIYLDDLWINKAHRKRGYGRKLVQALEDHFKGQGFNNINLVTSAFQAPEFYKKCGFTVEFVRENKINPQFTKTFFVKFFNDNVQTQGLLSLSQANDENT